MNSLKTQLSASAMAVLANGIIPADARDEGAAEVKAGPQLAAKLEAGGSRDLYREGLIRAEQISLAHFGRAVEMLKPAEAHELLERLKEQSPAFFKQLRMDVCALYLSDPAVWRRIGFPGPSLKTGGHPDFSEPQS